MGYLMKKPSVAVLNRAHGTFLEFLTRENLLPLFPIFLVTHTFLGEGYLDEVIDMAFINHVSPGVSNLWLDLEHAQACGKHIVADTETRQISLQRLRPQAWIRKGVDDNCEGRRSKRNL